MSRQQSIDERTGGAELGRFSDQNLSENEFRATVAFQHPSPRNQCGWNFAPWRKRFGAMKRDVQDENVAQKPRGREVSGFWGNPFSGCSAPVNDVAAVSESGVSGQKRPWMSALVDKLTGRTAAVQPADFDQDGMAGDEVGQRHDVAQTGSEKGLGKMLPLSRSSVDLGETQIAEFSLSGSRKSSESRSKTMTFTYAPGSRPLPPYTIRRGVGVGGFGEVYFAVSDAGKEVALKRIQRNLEIELRGVSQCLNLKHPNLVALYDIARDDTEQSWVVMEYVAGMNLRDALDQSPDGLPSEEVRRWFTGICAGVHHLHCAGLVHRDLKPGNVFDDLGIVKVGDYGLSKYISASQRGGHTESVGTFHYMAPEIGRGQYGREIDIYALGVILHELLTGRVPFDGESCHEIIVKHMTATPDLTEIAEPVRSVIGAALEKDPAKRPATVIDMFNAMGWGDITGVSALGSPVALVSQPTAAAIETTTDTQRRALSEPIARLPLTLPVATPITDAESSEPLARAVRKSAGDLRSWWNSMDQSPRAKAVFGLIIGFVLFVNTSWLVPALSVLAVFYVPYYIGRQMVLHARQQPSYAQAQRLAASVPAPSKTYAKKEWASHMRSDLRAKHTAVRIAELSSSWLAATGTVAAMTVGAGVFGLRSGDVNAMTIAPYGLLGVVVLIGSLGILGLGKLWEREDGEALPRRLVLAGLGAGVGLVAFGMTRYLMLPLSIPEREVTAMALPQALYDGNQLRASGMMAHFALLFAAIRWWRPVDPIRRKRLTLWNVAVISVAAWAIQQFLPVPQPFGILTAGGIAIAVQMSAPWINPRRVTPPQHYAPIQQPQPQRV
ncbi:serine/threonine protein kinase [Stieleria varia]|uniref:Serine/threonine-protein kinase PrkC n=1 Tax=Stieleria varia TaxID=2528005 RepID=A0A5C6AQ67_9BACT|nr:serine/threonine-protein kinase [Stieleria varia]TWU01226.1 Serine/threonine-protein kinase PrkC [Stieleria varia]